MAYTWGDAIEAWTLELKAAGRPATTIGTRTCHLRRFARHHRETSPWDITRTDIIEWLAMHPWATETRRSVRASLRKFYEWAVDDGRIDASPATKLPPVKPSQPNPRPVPHVDYLKALMAADVRERLMLRLAAEAGLRRGEVAVVHTRDVKARRTDDGRTVYSLVVHGKGGRVRETPLNGDLARELRDLPAGWVFPGGQGGHISPYWVGKLVRRLLPDGYTMHKLRHKCGTDAFEISGDLYVAKEILGHANINTTLRYVRRPDDKIRATLEEIGERRYERAA